MSAPPAACTAAARSMMLWSAFLMRTGERVTRARKWRPHLDSLRGESSLVTLHPRVLGLQGETATRRSTLRLSPPLRMYTYRDGGHHDAADPGRSKIRRCLQGRREKVTASLTGDQVTRLVVASPSPLSPSALGVAGSRAPPTCRRRAARHLLRAATCRPLSVRNRESADWDRSGT